MPVRSFHGFASRYSAMPLRLACAVLAASAVLLASGCSSALSTLAGGQALPFSNAQQAEQNAREKTDLDKRRAALEEVYEKYIKIIANSKEGSKFIDRARFAAAQLQKELVVPGGANYDRATQLLDDVIAGNPTGYLAARARSEKSAIRANREAIQTARFKIDNTPDDASDEQWAETLGAILSLADSYESLGDYETAISEYERMMEIANSRSKKENDVFYRKAAEAQFKIGNIYFYRYFNYADGWPEFVKLRENYPLSDQAKEAESILRDAAKSLQLINEEQDYIETVANKKALDYLKAGRDVTPYEIYGAAGEQAAQAYLRSARLWEKPPLVNRVYAIKNYRAITHQLWSESFVAGDAAFQIGRLYQDNGDYLKALDAYEEMFDRFPHSIWHNLAIYNRAVCYETIREFELAYREYKAAAGFGTDETFYRAAEQKVRQFEQDEDGDGYKFYQEQQHGASDRDKDSYPGSVKPMGEEPADDGLAAQ